MTKPSAVGRPPAEPPAEAPIRRESLSDQVFARLRDRLLSGQIAPGTQLPGERDLAAQFGVNRHAIREALKRLDQARLIETAHGGRTTALDWRRTAGLDLVVSLPGAGQVLALEGAQRDMLEMRACIGADAARLCALRAAPQVLEAVVAAAENYAAHGPDLDELDAADIAWWRLVIEGCGNLAYLLAFNSLVGGALAFGDTPRQQRTGELLDVPGRIRLARLIAERDTRGAELLARELLSRSIPALPGTADDEATAADERRARR
ncbi:FadR family transcriptional regulator [Actinocrinis puniceicyclus]|uniref:FadR family transcriptional regulator n=1 Tax=Actinocrinis puniceicyclus TaxID=977794 RepID=A0A8J7WT92_9ACTN|nr:GntR family transcriptional regulator [Actinocrinis puniceicyclus]MBS2965744.1 FadR family transcriptional regulator [Actinocrinis puniceicyclus]